MSGPRVVSARAREEVLATLDADLVIAVPGYGTYHLAARIDRPVALGALHALTVSCVEESPPHILVGCEDQAVAVASVWSGETRRLTDRMWPGPLTVIVPANDDTPVLPRGDVPSVCISMPTSRPLRLLCRESGPWMLAATDGPGCVAFPTVYELLEQFRDSDLSLIVDGGTRGGPGPTVVDCRVSPPVVLRVGEFPATYVDAALVMGARRRKWLRGGRSRVDERDGAIRGRRHPG